MQLGRNEAGDVDLPVNAKTSTGTPNRVYPTDPYPFCCPCVKSNFFSRSRVSEGPVLISVPPHLVPNWVKE